MVTPAVSGIPEKVTEVNVFCFGLLCHQVSIFQDVFVLKAEMEHVWVPLIKLGHIGAISASFHVLCRPQLQLDDVSCLGIILSCVMGCEVDT